MPKRLSLLLKNNRSGVNQSTGVREVKAYWIFRSNFLQRSYKKEDFTSANNALFQLLPYM